MTDYRLSNHGQHPKVDVQWLPLAQWPARNAVEIPLAHQEIIYKSDETALDYWDDKPLPLNESGKHGE